MKLNPDGFETFKLTTLLVLMLAMRKRVTNQNHRLANTKRTRMGGGKVDKSV